jgi:hypothetical protein
MYCIYVKNRSKGFWQLTGITLSAEAANQDISNMTKEAAEEGKESFQVGFQIFNSEAHIPTYLKELKKQKFLYN